MPNAKPYWPRSKTRLSGEGCHCTSIPRERSGVLMLIAFAIPAGRPVQSWPTGCRLIRRAHDLEHQENQERWIPIWTSETTVRRALGSEDPQRYWRVIVDEIGNLSPGSRDDFTKLRSVQWLPLAGGGVISPEDVIDIGDMASEIDRLSSCCGYPFAGIGGLLHPEVKAHTEFDTLRPLFSTGIEGLACLGQLMAEVPGYSVGSIGRIGNDELLIVAEIVVEPADTACLGDRGQGHPGF